MITIDIDIEDDKIIEFIDALIHFKQEECDTDTNCIMIDNMSLEDFKKNFINDSE